MAGEGGLRIRGASLEARGLTKTFGSTRVVQDVSFKVAGGALLTLLGPSGSGKTTTGCSSPMTTSRCASANGSPHMARRGPTENTPRRGGVTS
jgi:ABC-type spermidine/putrescine transport systems, ATPase components